MAYPEEIIAELITKYSLPAIQQQQLRECLMIEGVHHAIETSTFDPTALLIQIEEATIYIPSPSIMGQLLRNASCLGELKEYVFGDPASMKKYIEIREEIKRIDSLHLSRPRERTERKILLRQVSDKLESCYSFIAGNIILSLEVSTVSRIVSLYLNSELRWLQQVASQYFKEKLHQENKRIVDIAFLSKVDGVQMGNRMRIIYFDEKEAEHQITYYIKTHQYGSLRSGGSTTTPVDFKELFVYRALEYAGLGPKAYFFFNPLSPGAFFIATQDEGFTKIKTKTKFFKTYGQVQEKLESLSQISGITDAVKKGIALSDLLLRIFNLWDITTNAGNYGYVVVNQEREKWRVIDFRVETQEDYHFDRIFEDFQKGKGRNEYLGLSHTILAEAAPEERFRLATLLAEEFNLGRPCQSREGRKISQRESMERAYKDIRMYITEHHELLQLDLEKILPDFENYFTAIQGNLTKFMEDVMCHSTQARLEGDMLRPK